MPRARKLLTLGAVALLAALPATATATTTYPATNGSWAAYPGQSAAYGAAVKPPINADGTSNFKANGKAVIPIQFALTQAAGPFVFESIGSDTVAANNYSILQWNPTATFTFAELTSLVADYSFTTGDCHGGSLRWDIYVTHDGVSQVVEVYYGTPSGPDQGCKGASSGSGDNLITTGITDNRFEMLGGWGVSGSLYTTYADALASTNDGADVVSHVQLTLDSGWGGDQIVDLTGASVTVGNGATPAYTETWAPLPSTTPTAVCPTAEATISITKVDGTPSGTVNEPISVQPQDNDGVYRIVDCKYMYNLATSSLSGVGTYTAYATIGGTTFTVATFDLK